MLNTSIQFRLKLFHTINKQINDPLADEDDTLRLMNEEGEIVLKSMREDMKILPKNQFMSKWYHRCKGYGRDIYK